MSMEEYRRITPISAGPWGGLEGSQWDDGVHSTVKQLLITHGNCIDSIQIEYDNTWSSVWSDKHGGTGGINTDKVNLEYPDEYLTCVKGYYGSLSHWGPVLIRSLTFDSNKRSYGPFGTEQGTFFSLPTTGVKIVGFHGKCSEYLDAIGVHLNSVNQNPSKPLFHSQNLGAIETEKMGYSVMDPSVGQQYRIVLTVKQKDDYYSNKSSLSTKLHEQLSISKGFTNSGIKDNGQLSISKGSSDSGIKDKVYSVNKGSPRVDGAITYGPWGGTGGAMFDDGMSTGIRQINLCRNVGIVRIQVLCDHKGEALWGNKHGGSGGFKKDEIIFDFPSEILTHVTGFYGSLMYMGPNIIKSLTFHTNKGKYGPFGEEQGSSFTSKLKEGKIVGFHGREGLFVDAIGVHVIEGKVPPTKLQSQAKAAISEIESSQWSNKLIQTKQGFIEEVVSGVVKEPAPCGAGPWGGDGGRPWDDGVFSGIRQIYLTRGDAICSIQIEYDRNGQSIWSVKHGGNASIATHRVKLEFPNEVLICICGYYGSIDKEEQRKVVKSLTFYTSRGKYGPFGEEIGTFFTSTTTEGKVVGFHGRSGLYLDAIGVHMQHWLGNPKPPKPSLFKYFN